MFTTLLAIFIALNVISTIIILAACTVSGAVSHKMELAAMQAEAPNMRIELKYATPTAVSTAAASHA